MQLPWVKNRLANRLLFSILLFSGLVTLVITTVQLRIEYKRDMDGIDGQFARIERSFSKQIAEALWFFNEKALTLHLEGIFNLQDIEYLELTGDGDVRITVGKRASRYSVERHLPISHESRTGIHEIGELVIVASMSNVYSRLFDRLLIILISQTLKTFIVAIFIFFLFHYFVIRHLSDIDNYLKQYRVGSSTAPLSLQRRDRAVRDELDQVVDSINEATEELNESYDTLEHKVLERTKSLQKALREVRTLSGLLPLCSHCKKVRDDNGYWNQIDAYISEHSEADISHSICPDCADEYYPDLNIYEHADDDKKGSVP